MLHVRLWLCASESLPDPTVHEASSCPTCSFAAKLGVLGVFLMVFVKTDSTSCK